MEKQCFKCSNVKPLTQFYKHKRMGDGHSNKCKDCTKKDVREREEKLRKNDPDWVEKERVRGREKYHRLYSDNENDLTDDYKVVWMTDEELKEAKRTYIQDYKDRYPEKYKAQCLSSHIRKEGLHKHHWSYKEKHAKDIIWLTPKDHYKCHENIVYDQDHFFFRDSKGKLLDTKEKHIKYLKRKGVDIIKNTHA